MATTQRYGSARFEYTPLGESPTQHLLAVPLLISPERGFRVSRGRQRFEDWNADGTDREVFVMGTAYEEIVGQVRHDNEPASLRKMIREALENNVTLTYYPDGITAYPVLLVAVEGGDGQEIQPDSDSYMNGEWMAVHRLRRVDGGTFDALLPAS